MIGGNATCVDANYNCSGAPSSSNVLAQQNQDLSFLTSAQNVADGGACPCGLAHTGVCSAGAPSVNGGYCKNGNCVDGKCKLLECAISDSDGKVIARIGEGVKTCTKPSVLSGDGVYVCGEDSQEPQKLYSSDGSLSSEKEPFSGTIVYNLNLEETCYSGCSNGKCNDEAKCENLAKTIQDQFAKSYQPQTLACSNLSGDTQNEEYNKCKDCYDKVKTNTNKALSGFGDIVKVFEKLAYPNGLSCGGVWVISPDPNKSITNSAISSIRTDDILCAKTDTGAGGMTMNTACGKISVTGIQKNKICVGKDGEKFSSFLRGKSFDCKVINGCGVAGWILGDSPEKCNPGETNAFTLSDYFS
ncbi:MAG TPA: hypothetical protein PKK37_04790, partial [Candidatus Pacearchaeota archaeon]|nr:hypothetical protein [Candidatus Pacearchaeota archaeon]